MKHLFYQTNTDLATQLDFQFDEHQYCLILFGTLEGKIEANNNLAILYQHAQNKIWAGRFRLSHYDGKK